MQDHSKTEVEIQTEILPALVEGLEPDAYVVIPVALLTRQVEIDWNKVAREHRGEVRLGWLQVKLMRSLMGLGVLVNTRYPATKDDR